MNFPLAAENWENFQEKYPEDYDQPVWVALMPNVLDCTITVEELVPGNWHAHFREAEEGEPHDLLFDEHAPPLPSGPFTTAEEAKAAVDRWCAQWAPMVTGLESIYSIRRLVTVDKSVNMGENDKHQIGICSQSGTVEEVLSATRVDDLIHGLRWAMQVAKTR